MFFFSALAAACALAGVQASPIAPRAALDVYVPHIETPNSQTVWIAGQSANMGTDTSDAPAQISNEGLVVLRHPYPIETLAEGFDLRAGFVEFTVPADLAAGSDYTIALFGDSGNISEEFSIKAA
ncbi:hypothetical protein GGG16DRAFT_61663 [Schizophyllum commune]